MFTGLIEGIGTLRVQKNGRDFVRVRVEHPFQSALGIGDSVAVNGVCLTVIHQDSHSFQAEVQRTTLEKTNLKNLRGSVPVNLERALQANARLDGHMVQGHVAGCGRFISVKKQGNNRLMRVRVTQELRQDLILEGSIAVDGISLTVAHLGSDWVDIGVIPHTWENTTLKHRHTGDLLNLEADVLLRFAREATGPQSSSQTETRRRQTAFASMM
ncbi:MAG: riboflavin synthase [Spirochaetales bacterium]|nr:riboflavin synthase [Spirochaetales bacterium]